VVYGSADCSASAWLRPIADGGNVEAVIVVDNADPRALEGLIEIDEANVLPHAEVTFGVSDWTRDPSRTAPRIHWASWTRSTKQLACVFDKPVNLGSRVQFVVEDHKIEAHQTGPQMWLGALENLHELGKTRFVTAIINADPLQASKCWIDDVEALDAMRARSIDFSQAAGLAGGGGGTDPTQTLRGISKLSSWLLREWPEKDERSIGGSQPSDRKTEQPQQPVSVNDIFQSLDEIHKTPHLTLGQISGSSISLAGIMNLVFGQSGSKGATIAADTVADELRETGQKKETDDDQTGDDQPLEQAEISELKRTQLIRQFRRFVDSLADAEFAGRCTARQLQQSVAFPLACSLFAARGGWIETAEDEASWHDIVRRVCELLLLASSSATPKGQDPRTLIEFVRSRYAEEERLAEFDSVIGDGTLWVLLLAVASGQAVVVDLTERDLLLSDILDCSVLRSQRSAQQLAELCVIADVEDRSGEWLRTARAASSSVNRPKSQLQPVDPNAPPKFRGVAQVGDWLWNQHVGFVRVESVGENGKLKVHIRQKAKVCPNVSPSYYVNLRLAGLT